MLESALSLAGTDATGAARILVSVAQKDAAEHLVLNNSTRAAVNESIAAEELAQWRRELVDWLDRAGRGGANAQLECWPVHRRLEQSASFPSSTLRAPIALSDKEPRKVQRPPQPGQELTDRIVACQLGDLGFEYRVRRVLGISLGDLRARWMHYRHEASSQSSWNYQTTAPFKNVRAQK